MADEVVVNVADQLTLLDVVDPGLTARGGSILSEAKRAHAAEANKMLQELGRKILAKVQNERAVTQRRINELAAELKTLNEKSDKIARGCAYAESEKTGIFALAAVVGAKSEVMDFARQANIVVPDSKDKVWSLPE